MDNIWTVAKDSLEENSIQTSQGLLTVAGGNHFKTFWVRDFCYSVPGLLSLGHTEQVRDQLLICLNNINSEGLIARGFDVVNPKFRILAQTFKIPWMFAEAFGYAGDKPLKTEFLGEHGTQAMDSNALVLLACLQWTEKTKDMFFWETHGYTLKKVYDFILKYKNNGLLEQVMFSDWQDSARREGKTFYLNLLFTRVLVGLKKLNIGWAAGEDVKEWTDKMWETYFDSHMGLFRSQVGRDQFSLETHLWCIEENIFADYIPREKLWESLRHSPLWGTLPGRPVWPKYSDSDVSWTTKFVGLRHYHDGFHWSWLMAESLKVAQMMGDESEAQKIRNELLRLTSKYKTVHEIYETNSEGQLKPVSRPLYKSEHSFSWGAAKILEALSLR